MTEAAFTWVKRVGVAFESDSNSDLALVSSMEPPPAKSPPKSQLITPSASPPPPGHPFRMSESSKRQRVTSTPRRTMSEASSSASRQMPDDVDKERRASAMRLLDSWASLEERYSRPLDEDDIIDIRTGEIIKDNGFLRNFRKVDFGTIAASAEDDVTADGGSDVYEEEEEHEYDIDELDAFAEVNAEVGESETSEQRIVEYLGSVRPPSSQLDSEDLREFMDAERRRREFCGSDIDEEDETGYYSAEDILSDVQTEADLRIEPKEGEEEEGEGEFENKKAPQNEVLRSVANQSVITGPSSEDELDNWDLGEASVVHPVVKNEPVEDSDSDIELIENPASINSSLRPDSSERAQNTHEKSLPLPQTPRKFFHQLYTPPQSQSSTIRSDTPASDRFIDLSTDSPPVPSASSSRIFGSESRVANDRTAKSKLKPVNSEKPQPQTSPKKVSRLKPYVLLTPRKVLPKTKEHDNPSPTQDVKGKGKAKETDAIISGSESFDPEIEHSSPRTVFGEKRRAKSRGPQIELSEDRPNPITTPSSKASKNMIEMTPSIKEEPKSQKPVASKSYKPETVSNDVEKINPRQLTSYVREFTPSPRKRKRSGTPESLDGLIPRERTKERGNSINISQGAGRASTPRIPGEISSASNRASPSRSPAKKRRSSRGSQGSPRGRSGTESESYSSVSEADDIPHSHEPHHHARMRRFSVPQPNYAYPYPPYIHPPHPHYPNLQAQQIISSAVQQLSALFGTPWPVSPAFADPSVPQTPSRDRHGARRVNDPYKTPMHHPHPHPYVYDPNLSHATLPPESPEADSSPEKSVSGRRKSLVGRSRSRGRRVSFVVEEERVDEMVVHPSPGSARLPKIFVRREHQEHDERDDQPTASRGKGKQKETSLDGRYRSDDDVDSGAERPRREYRRAQTPGPSSGPSSSPTSKRVRTGSRKQVEK